MERPTEDIKCILADGESLGTMQDTKAISYADKKEYLELAESLDKADMFDHLMIASDEYKYREYDTPFGKRSIGIKLDKNIHRGQSPILPYQTEAVKTFLGSFRGIGILADEVGMGKTIEAGMIISELAERKLASSLLIVAAHEDNCRDWERVLDEYFGLNGMIRIHSAVEMRDNCEDGIPSAPFIMTFDDFCALPKDALRQYLFDIIAFDEAHNLDDSDEGTRGMECLRALMVRKKQANKPYCILISGTPHKGNLDSMFPLWYFVKGGTDYDREKRHYKEFLCNGASTIGEFIESFKIKGLKDDKGYAGFWHDRRMKEELAHPDSNVDVIMRIKSSSLMDEYLSLPENTSVRNAIRKTTKDAYNSLIKSFMIRQSRIQTFKAVQKKALNYYFVRTKTGEKAQKVIFNKMVLRGASGNFDFTYDCTDLYAPDAITYKGQQTSLDEFARSVANYDYRGNEGVKHQIKTQIIFGALDKFASFSGEVALDEGEKAADKDYYYRVVRQYSRDIDNRFEIIDQERSLFEEKCEKLFELLSMPERKDKKAIVFFDYYSGDRRDEDEKAYAYYRVKYSDFCKRIIYEPKDDEKAARLFADGSDGNNKILFASEKLSESSNFQFCDTAVNFTVCHSPIKMDQRIGRIDRLGQAKDMEIISFAGLNRLEGYLLTFYNKIKLFSGWKDDIILVTGCDNKHALVMKCKECECSVRSIDVKDDDCPICGARHSLAPRKTANDFKCPKCDETFVRNQGGKRDSLCYSCNQPLAKKLICAKVHDETYYLCDKACILDHCYRAENADCGAREAYRENNLVNINVLLKICEECKTPFCDNCSLEYNGLGYDIDGFFGGKSCMTCEDAECKYVQNINEPLCPHCGTPMKAVEPSTFDQFVADLWVNGERNTVNANSRRDRFVESFEREINKISDIVATLGNGNDEDGGQNV